MNWKEVKSYEDITYKKCDGVARIAFNRPDVRNAFRPRTVSELFEAFLDAREDTSIGVVLLSAEGPSSKDGVFSFCSGGDQNARGHQGYVDDDGMPRLNILEVQRLIRFMPKVVICVVPGWAVGGGHSLHAVCDLTLASKEHAIFKQTDADVGSFDAGYGIKGPGYSQNGPDGKRWTYAQANPAWHSTVRTVSGTKDFGQVVDAKAAVSMQNSRARVDLSSALAGATSAERAIELSSLELTITDRIRGRNQPYAWSWVTQASVSVQGQVVTLSQAGRTATLTFDELPEGASISVSSGPTSLGAPATRIEISLPSSGQIDLVAHLRW